MDGTSRPEETLYGIADLAERRGVSPRAIRFYEQKGLLSPRRVNGQRVYDAADDKRLELILRAKAIGTKLSDIKTFLDLYGREGEGRERQLQFVIDRTAQEIAALTAKKAQIEETLAELAAIHEGAKARLARRRG